jgi:hypothetical protein
MKHFTVIHVSSLLSTATPGPLLRLVWLQDRGVCKFVGLLKDLANIATQVLSTVITREVFFCPDKIEFFYDNLVAW